MDVAVPEETFKKRFRAKKTMKVSDRKQLEFLRTSLPSPRSIPSQPQQAVVPVKPSEDAVSMEVDDTRITDPTTSSLTTTSLATETCNRTSASMVASPRNTWVKELSGNESQGPKESVQPSREGVEDENALIKGHGAPMPAVFPGNHVTSERTDESREKGIVSMEIGFMPISTPDTLTISDPAASPLLSSITTGPSTCSSSLSPTHTAESDPDVRPGFLVLSEDDDEQDDEVRSENEGRCEEMREVNMKKPEQFGSGAPVDCSFPSSPVPLQIHEDVESNGASQGKQAQFGDYSEDCGKELGEGDLDMVERPYKRPRIDCEELETQVEIKISGNADWQSKLKKVVQQLVDEQLRVLQTTRFDQTLQELRGRIDQIDRHQRLHSNLKRLQAKFDQLSKKIGTAKLARENPYKTSEVLLTSACTDATATVTLTATATPALATSSDTTPATSSDTTPATSSDNAPATSSVTAPATSSVTAPATSSVTAPATSSDTAPATSSDTAPVTAPATSSGTAPATSSGTAPATSSDTALIASTSASAIVGLRMLVKNTSNLKCNDQRNQVPTHVPSGASLPPSPSTQSEAPTQTLMLRSCVASTPVHSGFSLQPLLIQLPGGGTAIFRNPTNSQLIPVSTLSTLTSSTSSHRTAFILQRSGPSTSALLSHYAATLTNIPTTLTAPVTVKAATTSHMATARATPMATARATPMATARATPLATLTTIHMSSTTPRATTTNVTMATATSITPSSAITKGTSNVVHFGASGPFNKPSSGVSVSVCKSILLESAVYSTSSASVPRLLMPGPTVPQAAPAQLAGPAGTQVPVKTGSQATNPPSDLTKTFPCTISDAFIDLTEDDDDDDVLVTGVLNAPMVCKASPTPSTAGQQTTTSSPVGKKAVRFSLDHTLARSTPEVVDRLPLQTFPSESATETTSSPPFSQTSPVPPLPAPPPAVSLPLESVNTKPPQQPLLKLTHVQTKDNGIVLSWSVTEIDRSCAAVDCYHLYAYNQDHSGSADTDTTSSFWKKIGEVKALALPMACTLTQFVPGSKYYFAVCARDIYGRFGPFCEPQCTDVLMPTSLSV